MPNRNPVCLDMSNEAERELSHLNPEDKNTSLWQIENTALTQFKQYKKNWEEHISEIGYWEYPTVNKIIRFHWRFEGVEENKPVFFINHITCEENKVTYKASLSSNPEKTHELSVNLMLIIMLVTMFVLVPILFLTSS